MGSDDFPGSAECRFADRFGREWIMVEKLPILTVANLRLESQFTRPVLIACEVVASLFSVMAGPVPAIHVLLSVLPKDVDARDKPRADGEGRGGEEGGNGA